MIRSSFCVVLCGEVVNVRLRNILNLTEPREKKIHRRTRRVETPYKCVLAPRCHHIHAVLRTVYLILKLELKPWSQSILNACMHGIDCLNPFLSVNIHAPYSSGA
jgi:hypothetical protein